MDTTDQYFDCLCRTCMNELEATPQDCNTKPQQQWQSIFDRIEGECGAFRITELLTNAVPQIEVHPGDELPKRICSKCLQQLLSVYRFQKMCVQSEQQMRQQLLKKQADSNIPAAPIKIEIRTSDADSFPLTSVQLSSTRQDIKDSSIQAPLLETKDQVVKPEVAETSDGGIDELLKHCNEPQDNISELVKNEPIEDDDSSIECSDYGPIHSIVSVKEEVLAEDSEQQQKQNETNAKGEPYECPHCSRTFRTKSRMLQHKAIHEEGNREACDICGKSMFKKHLKQHKLIHSDQKPHKCNICEKSFALLGNLRVHIRKHTGEKPYKCKYCDRSFAGISLRAQHMRFHLGADIYRCELCPLAFPLASELRVHFLTHTNEDPETRERNMQALKEAEAIDRGNVESHHKPYECPYCPRRFREKSYMLQHKATHEEGERERETCDICGKSMRKKHLKTHKLIHSDQKPHKCDFCEKSFAQLSNLRRHIRSHTDERPYKCKYCERTFANYTSHVYHMRNHLGDNIHRCEVCPLAFPVASELRVHLTTHKNDDSETRKRNLKALKEVEAKLQLKFSKQKTENVEAHPTIHGEDKCYDCPEGVEKETCDICGKSIIKRDLKTHKLIHSDQKRHKCDFCQKSFTRKDYLRVHINKHTGEKPYKCKYCDRSFAGITLRRQHSRRIHLGANVHRCELCPLAFPLASELRVHLTTHKNEDPESRERNMKALKEAEAKLQLKLCKKETRQSLRGVAGTT